MSQGAASPPDVRQQLRETRAQVKLARAERELAGLKRRTKQLTESNVLWDWVNGYSDLLDRLRTSDERLLLAPSTVQDRRWGSNWPFWRTWQEHALLRAQSRLLCTVSDIASGVLSGLTSYVVGDGMTHRAAAKKGKNPPASLVEAVQAEIDDHILRNNLPEYEQEVFKRDRRDGESFTRDFIDDEGRTEVATILPEQVMDPPNCDLDTDSFGIFNIRGHLERITAFWVCYDGIQSDGEEVPIEEVSWSKVNVDRVVKRGMPDFVYDTAEGVKISGRCVLNMVESAAIQASIAEIRQHETATPAQVQTFVDDEAEFQTPNPFNGAQVNNHRVTPGTVRDIPKGLQYVKPPFSDGGPAWIQIVQASLRKCAVRWNAPEWLTSADASNNNYASSLTAEAPFTRRVLRWQGHYRRLFGAGVRRAIKAAADAGRIRAEGRTWTWDEIRSLVEILTEAPSLEIRDKAAEAQANATYIQAAVKSVQTTQQELGLDSEREAQNLEEWQERFGQQGQPLPLPGEEGADGEGAPFGQQQGPAGTDSTSELRASVGGSQALLSLQTSVYKGEVPREAAIANAHIVFGFSAEQAAQLFPDIPPTKTADDGQDQQPPVAGEDEREGEEELPSPFAEGLSEALHRDRRGHKFCTDDSTGKRTSCGDPKANADSARNQKAPPTVKRAHQSVNDLVDRFHKGKGPNPQPGEFRAAVSDLAEDLRRMTGPEVEALAENLGLKAGGGRKVDMAYRLASRALGTNIPPPEG